jgi:hypothetical protein
MKISAKRLLWRQLLGRMPMFRSIAFVTTYLGVLLVTVASAQAAQYGTAEDAKAMLDRAVAAVKEDKAKALDLFNKGEGGFKDRDLYVLCANASDGIITAHPTHKGGQLKNFPLGREVMRTASEGKVSEVTYPWPRPGSIKPLEKHTFYTKVGDQICGVGYYKE